MTFYSNLIIDGFYNTFLKNSGSIKSGYNDLNESNAKFYEDVNLNISFQKIMQQFRKFNYKLEMKM